MNASGSQPGPTRHQEPPLPPRHSTRPGAEAPSTAQPLSPAAEEARDQIAQSTGFVTIGSLVCVGLGIAAGPGLGTAFILVAVVVLLGSLAIYVPLELKERRFLKDEAQRRQAHGQDYVDPDLLTQHDRDALISLQRAVDTVLASPLHSSGQLLDTTRNSVVLRDLEWQIACDLWKASRAEAELAAVGGPRGDGEMVLSAHERATRAIEEIRSAVANRTDAITGYAARVQQAQERLEDAERAAEYERIANDLLAETSGGTQQDEALQSLLAVQQEALKIAQLHHELGL
jgi:hypothetical protein